MADTYYTIYSGFYDSVAKDRLYSADDMNRPYKSIISEGIFSIDDDFAVVPSSGMVIQMKAGVALLGERWIDASATLITVPENAGLQSRTDSVILQINNESDVRAGRIVYRPGVADGSGEYPGIIIGNDNIHELILATVTVAAGATSIAAANITSKRGTIQCPYAKFIVGDAQIEESVESVLADHPEWTTTVQDGSITMAKLNSALASIINGHTSQIADLNNALDTGFMQNNYVWQRGGLDGLTITTTNYRLVTTDLQTAEDDIIIKNTNTTYKYAIVWLIDDVYTWTDWILPNTDNLVKIPSGATYRIVIAKVTEDYVRLTDAEVATMSKILYVSTGIYNLYKDTNFSKEASVYGIGIFDVTDFIIGVYYPSGAYYKDTARVCTRNKMSFSFDTVISVKTGYRIGANILDAQGNVSLNIPFGTAPISIPKNTFFNLNIDNGNTSATANSVLYASQISYVTPILMDINELKSVGMYSYEGVNIKPKTNGFNTSQLSWSYSSPTTEGTFTPQAMSYSNGVVFKCWKENLIQLYDFDDGSKIAEYAVTCEHGDCMSFSDEYYDSDDEFPLAYFTSDTTPLKVYVNRLTRSGATLIRTLEFTTENAGYYAGHAVDAINNRLITLGYTENSFETNTSGTNYMICAVWDLNDLTLNNDGVTYRPALLKKFTLPFIICTQDQCYYNNKFFVISSNWQNTDTIIYVIDIGEESVVAKLSDIPYKAYETEGIFWVNNDMYVNGNGITKYTFL